MSLEACRFRHESPFVRVKQVFTDYAVDCFPSGGPILVCAQALMTKLHRDVQYAPGDTTIETPLPRVLEIVAASSKLAHHDDRVPAIARPRGALRERICASVAIDGDASAGTDATGSGRVRNADSLVGSWRLSRVGCCQPAGFGWLGLDPTSRYVRGQLPDQSLLLGPSAGSGDTHHFGASLMGGGEPHCRSR